MPNEPLIDVIQVRFLYTSSFADHKLQLYARPSGGLPVAGTAASSIDFLTRGAGSGSDISGEIDDLVTYILPFLVPETEVTGYEIWGIPANTFDAYFITAGSFTGKVGTNVGNDNPGGQLKLVMRTNTGRTLQVNLFGTAVTNGNSAPFPITGDTPTGNLYAEFFAAGSPWCDRAGGYVIAGLSYNPGVNEHWVQELYR